MALDNGDQSLLTLIHFPHNSAHSKRQEKFHARL